jgi:hypothetical protein
MRRGWLALLALAACDRGAPPAAADVPGIEVRAHSVTLKRGKIGVEDPREATYVFVDVGNATQADRLVAVEGVLLDASGTAGGRVVGGELRIPAGASRAFALMADGVDESAVGAKIRLHHATVVDYPDQVVIANEKLTPVGEFQVATAEAVNRTEKDAMASVMAAFYDADGKVLARPFVVLAVKAGGTRALRFEGPKSSTRATVFIGELTY